VSAECYGSCAAGSRCLVSANQLQCLAKDGDKLWRTCSNRPLVQHKLALIAAVGTEPKSFVVLREITTLCYKGYAGPTTVEIDVKEPPLLRENSRHRFRAKSCAQVGVIGRRARR